MADADSVVGLLHLAHYHCEDNWYSCPLALDGTADDSKPKDVCDCGADERNAALGALLERLQRAEAALDVVGERLCTEVAIAVTLGQGGYMPAYSVLAEALEDTVEALVAAGRGVTGTPKEPQ